MSTPTFVTSENVRFDGTLQNAVVLDNTAGVRSLIVWDTLSADEQTLLNDFINARGGASPLAAAIAGTASIDVGSGAIGTTPTGLSSVADASATATVGLSGATGSTVSGLSGATGVAGFQIANFNGVLTGGASTGLDGATTYTATVVVDGVSKPISILGSDAATFTTLISQLNTDLGSAATATLSNGDIMITSATASNTSTVSITLGTLFPALAGFVDLLPAVNGETRTKTYSAVIEIDGKSYSVTSVGNTLATMTDVVSAINTAIGSAGTAAITGGNLVITTASTTSNSYVRILDSGFLFKTLTGFTGTTYVAGTSAQTYSVTITVDGTDYTVSATGPDMQTMADVVTVVSAVFAGFALTGGKFVVTSTTTGPTSTAVIKNDMLFKFITGYNGITSVPGATSLLAAVKSSRTPSGALFSDAFRIITVGAKPSVPLTVKHNTRFIYYGGSPADWRYLDDDTIV